jgi:hypothetical protein
LEEATPEASVPDKAAQAEDQAAEPDPNSLGPTARPNL